MTFKLTSNLTPDAYIPTDYYGNQFGYAEKNLSPLLAWQNAPEGTKSFAITLFDQDAPTGSGFWHYMLINIFALFSYLIFSSTIASAAEKFALQSNLKPGQSIPADYYANAFGCSAKSTSPRLEWKNEPAGTKSFAITFYDKDAPTGSGFWHYVLFDIPANVHKIEIGDLTAAKIPPGSVESMTDAGKPGYFGPCPPAGRKHTYIYTVYALKTEKLGVSPTSTPAYVGFNLWGNTLDKASFTVTAGPRK